MQTLLLFLLFITMLFSGLYILSLQAAPVFLSPAATNTWNKPVPVQKKELTEDRVYIPRLKLNLTFKSGDESVLLQNLWHRAPQNGDPEKGGNFVLAGHRFELGPTPQQTIQKSPLYHVEKLEVGDKLYADFKGKRYEYEITQKTQVPPTQVEIESQSVEPVLTLYTCTLGGSTDGREVIIAKRTASDIDPSQEF